MFSTLNKLAVFVVFTFAATLFLDRLIPEGMFFDGLSYASLARNLSIGKASIWQPIYFEPFYEHPPLAWSLQAVFFLVFGDHYYTEKIFCFFVWLLTVYLIVKVWKVSCSAQELSNYYWLPVLLWTIAPTVIWCYPNNMLESLMGLFDLLAVLLIFSFLKSESIKIWKSLVAGMVLVMALFTKGFVGLFPFALPLIYWFLLPEKNLRKAMIAIASLVGITILSVVILYQYSPCQRYFDYYLNTQLWASLSGKRDVVESDLGRLFVIKQLFIELIPAVSIFVIAKGVLVYKKNHLKLGKVGLLFILLGFSASLPLMVSLKLRAFYLVPSIPYFAIGLAHWLAPYLVDLKFRVNNFSFKLMKVGYLLSVAVSFFFLVNKVGTVGRDADLISDLKEMKGLIQLGSRASICPDSPQSWATKAYAQRYLQLVFDKRGDNSLFVFDRKHCADYQLIELKNEGWMPISSRGQRFIFLKRK